MRKARVPTEPPAAAQNRMYATPAHVACMSQLRKSSRTPSHSRPRVPIHSDCVSWQSSNSTVPLGAFPPRFLYIVQHAAPQGVSTLQPSSNPRRVFPLLSESRTEVRVRSRAENPCCVQGCTARERVETSNTTPSSREATGNGETPRASGWYRSACERDGRLCDGGAATSP
jgi:hypothetical protein